MEQKLVQVERGNVILRVPEYDVQRYIDQGYDLLDDSGKVIRASVPKDLGTLQLAYIQHEKKIAELEKELALEKSKKRPSSRNKKREE
jgi:hypothetical protein